MDPPGRFSVAWINPSRLPKTLHYSPTCRSTEELGTLTAYSALLLGRDESKYLESVSGIRQHLSGESPPIQEVLGILGLVPKLLRLLGSTDPGIQLECAWIMANLVSDSSAQTEVLVSAGLVQPLLALLDSQYPPVQSQALRALGNVAGYSLPYRDLLISLQLPSRARKAMEWRPKSIEVTRQGLFCFHNMCRGKPRPDEEQVGIMQTHLARALHFTDPYALSQAVWCLCHLSDGDAAEIEDMIRPGVARQLVVLSRHQDSEVRVPALRALARLLSGELTEDYYPTQIMLEAGALPSLGLALSRTPEEQRDVLRALSKITAAQFGRHIQTVCDSNLLPHTLVLLAQSPTLAVRIEAAMTFSNALSGGSSAQVQFMAKLGLVPVLCDLWFSPSRPLATIASRCLDSLLAAGEELAEALHHNPFLDEIERTAWTVLPHLEELREPNAAYLAQVLARLHRRLWNYTYFTLALSCNTTMVKTLSLLTFPRSPTLA